MKEEHFGTQPNPSHQAETWKPGERCSAADFWQSFWMNIHSSRAGTVTWETALSLFFERASPESFKNLRSSLCSNSEKGLCYGCPCFAKKHPCWNMTGAHDRHSPETIQNIFVVCVTTTARIPYTQKRKEEDVHTKEEWIRRWIMQNWQS